MSQLLMNHGGACCGAKTIKGFPIQPSQVLPALGHAHGNTSPELWPSAEGVTFTDTTAGTRFYRHARPQEAAEARFRFYIDFLKKTRPGHMVEVILIGPSPKKGSSSSMMDQDTRWRPILEEVGFKEVSKWENSNSNNVLFCYHLILTKQEEEKS